MSITFDTKDSFLEMAKTITTASKPEMDPEHVQKVVASLKQEIDSYRFVILDLFFKFSDIEKKEFIKKYEKEVWINNLKIQYADICLNQKVEIPEKPPLGFGRSLQSK